MKRLEPFMREWSTGSYILYGDHIIETQELRTALEACVRYMESEDLGYEIYRATLDAAKAALAPK